MSMDTAEEAMAPINNNNSSSSTNENKEEDHSSHAVVKRKRTKRQRFLLHLPPPNLITTTSSASSSEFSGSTTEEEEDMANCLILLAQGKALESGPKTEEEAGGGGGAEKFTSSRRFAEAATTTNGKAGFYVYECKTCNKCFSSFQALGGHRASHKKPKMMAVAAAADEDKKAMDEDSLQISIGCFPKPIMLSHNTTSNNKSRVHECSICGSEFSSGQALGGHMRRHRSVIIPESQEVKKDKNILSLDLNLPAPSEEDDHAGDFPKSPPSSSFAFASKQPLIFSASALVDCHY